MNKRLDGSAITNELKQSVFFHSKEEKQPEKPKQFIASDAQKKGGPPLPSSARDTVVSRHHDIMVPRDHDTAPSSIPSPLVPYSQETVEHLRGAVKQLGKEAATHRFTVGEKRALKSIAFEYANKDIQTSENEITRIAVNFLLDDYRQRKEHSLLARVLDSLNK
jgi:hypothetical protein